jgi:DNA-binding NarL/FixJ family response regulator
MRLLLCGVVVYPQTLFADRAPAPTAAAGPDGDLLTAREWEILALVATGKQNKTIADELGLSEHTAKLHIHHMLRKLEVTNRTAAATWFSALPSEGTDRECAAVSQTSASRG